MKITLFRIVLVFDQPWRFAEPDGTSVIDRPAATDGYGRPYVPTTSLAGSLRASLGAELAAELMGSAPGTDLLTPSRLRLLGTRVDGVSSERVTTTTAIDAHRGAAKAKTLRSASSYDQGATVTIFAELDGEAPLQITDALASWMPRLGSDTTSGFGRATVSSISTGLVDTTTDDGLSTWLRLNGPDLFDAVCTREVAVPESTAGVVVDLPLRFVDGYHSGGTYDAELKLNQTYRRGGEIYIEGTSLKGAIRSRCAVIERSLRSDESCPTTERMFGSTSSMGRVSVEGAPVKSAGLVPQPHVAIDRFTGGAAPGLLWHEEVVEGGHFQLRIAPVRAMLTKAEKALLLAAVRDLCDGCFGLGAKTTRGLGTVEVVGRIPDEIASALPLAAEDLSQLRADQPGEDGEVET